jgi:preprotein translocase subunit YajC
LLNKPKEEGGSDLECLNATLVIVALFFVAFGVEMYFRPKAKKFKERQNDVEDLEAETEDA